MLSWQAMILNGFFRFTMKRHGKRPLNLARLRAMTKNPLAVTGASVEANAKSCAMFTPRGVREAAAMYLAGANARDPRASPLYADLSGLPPMLLFASRHEILRDDTLRLAERASAAGVKVELVVRDRLPHVWPVFVTLLPEARDAFATVTAFARQIGARNAA